MPGSNGWQSESFSTKRLGCSIGKRGWVIDIVLSAPSLSCQSSSLHTQIIEFWENPYCMFCLNFIWFIVKLKKALGRTFFLPITLIRGRDIRRMTPQTHLKHSQEQHRVNSQKFWRECETHDLAGVLGGITEVVGVRECLKGLVESDGALNCEIWKDPILCSERTWMPQKALHKTPNPYLPPWHVEVIKPKVVIVLQPWDVKPIIDYHSNPA